MTQFQGINENTVEYNLLSGPHALYKFLVTQKNVSMLSDIILQSCHELLGVFLKVCLSANINKARSRIGNQSFL